MQVGIQRGGLNPNKGMDTRKFLVAVGGFLAFALFCILAWSVWSAHTARPSVRDHGKAGDGVTATEKGGAGR